MYSRNSKGIAAKTWDNLMQPVTKEELLQTIKEMDKNKAPGYDGVSIDLLKLLACDLSHENPSLDTLLGLIQGRKNP